MAKLLLFSVLFEAPVKKIVFPNFHTEKLCQIWRELKLHHFPIHHRSNL